ncbi:type II toxin-antitoxin system HicB family antitoxin [Companilactobacillus halodurans]|uniref:HicB family protein n=1 Tax=Companilactobacillus halodurans TaxID=2584183 RepID=A0A5P0ZPT8_9LACO|nr:type II toxin-antitoxin system HicB family antitoxin [Companilactobacillus halodurans]MQS76263.1 HicB family protein [Companilactobacillus halodurans]MQS96609.1 HicB family protein [Companilactobacillus halodurans]
MKNNKNTLVYPVILHPEDSGYSVEIPDIDHGTWTQGENMKDALMMAQDAVGLMLEDETDYPKATPLEDIVIKKDEIKTIVYLNLEEYRRNNPKTVRKNVTVPEYLVVLGKKKNINFSAVLTEALKNKLDE